jgi:hypothetical protein
MAYLNEINSLSLGHPNAFLSGSSIFKEKRDAGIDHSRPARCTHHFLDLDRDMDSGASSSAPGFRLIK